MGLRVKKKPTIIKYQNLTVKLIKGRFGEYSYLSPRWGYKRGFRHNQVIYIYANGVDGYLLEKHCFKNATRKEIIEYLKEFKDSAKYKVLIKRASRR